MGEEGGGGEVAECERSPSDARSISSVRVGRINFPEEIA